MRKDMILTRAVHKQTPGTGLRHPSSNHRYSWLLQLTATTAITGNANRQQPLPQLVTLTATTATTGYSDSKHCHNWLL